MIRKETVSFETEKIVELISNIIGLKKQGDIEEAHELASETLSKYFQLPLEDLERLTPEELNNTLKTRAFLPEKLDLLAQLIFETAHPFLDIPEVHTKLHLILAIYNYLESVHHIQSLNNLARREMIDKFLNNQQYE